MTLIENWMNIKDWETRKRKKANEFETRFIPTLLAK